MILLSTHLLSITFKEITRPPLLPVLWKHHSHEHQSVPSFRLLCPSQGCWCISSLSQCQPWPHSKREDWRLLLIRHWQNKLKKEATIHQGTCLASWMSVNAASIVSLPPCGGLNMSGRCTITTLETICRLQAVLFQKTFPAREDFASHWHPWWHGGQLVGELFNLMKMENYNLIHC